MTMLYIGTTISNLKAISPDPSAMQWGLQDISAADAGRVHDAGNTMYKMRTSQKRKLSITWNMPTKEQVAAILQAVNPEYFYVRYEDAMTGTWRTMEAYVGDRTAPFQWFNVNGGTRYSTLSFDIIER